MRMKEAKLRAQLFLFRIKDLETKMAGEIEPRMVFFRCRETAALRRASMDLTRALADMRKP